MQKFVVWSGLDGLVPPVGWQGPSLAAVGDVNRGQPVRRHHVAGKLPVQLHGLGLGNAQRIQALERQPAGLDRKREAQLVSQLEVSCEGATGLFDSGGQSVLALHYGFSPAGTIAADCKAQVKEAEGCLIPALGRVSRTKQIKDWLVGMAGHG